MIDTFFEGELSEISPCNLSLTIHKSPIYGPFPRPIYSAPKEYLKILDGCLFDLRKPIPEVDMVERHEPAEVKREPLRHRLVRALPVIPLVVHLRVDEGELGFVVLSPVGGISEVDRILVIRNHTHGRIYFFN